MIFLCLVVYLYDYLCISSTMALNFFTLFTFSLIVKKMLDILVMIKHTVESSLVSQGIYFQGLVKGYRCEYRAHISLQTVL